MYSGMGLIIRFHYTTFLGVESVITHGWTGSGLFMCARHTCTEILDSYEAYQAHRAEAHPTFTDLHLYRCLLCPYIAARRYLVNKHQEKHLLKGMFQCRYCHQFSSVLKHHQRHELGCKWKRLVEVTDGSAGVVRTKDSQQLTDTLAKDGVTAGSMDAGSEKEDGEDGAASNDECTPAVASADLVDNAGGIAVVFENGTNEDPEAGAIGSGSEKPRKIVKGEFQRRASIYVDPMEFA